MISDPQAQQPTSDVALPSKLRRVTRDISSSLPNSIEHGASFPQSMIADTRRTKRYGTGGRVTPTAAAAAKTMALVPITIETIPLSVPGARSCVEPTGSITPQGFQASPHTVDWLVLKGFIVHWL